MSKVVKGIGRAIGGVIKGVVNVVKGVVSGVKKIASSKIGKIILAAATVYFGGAAIMGAMGGASAGTGFLGTIGGAVQGAGAGIANAWSGLTGAFTGGGFSALGKGFTGAYSAGSGAVGSAAQAATTAATNAATSGATQAAGTGVATTPNPLVTNPVITQQSTVPLVPPSNNPGIISSAWNGLGDYGKMAAVQGTMQLAGGAIQGYGQQKAMEEQRAYELEQEQLARDRYNQNIGTRLWGKPSADTTGGAYAYAAAPAYDPVAESRIRAQRYANIANNAGIINSNIPVMYAPKVG